MSQRLFRLDRLPEATPGLEISHCILPDVSGEGWKVTVPPEGGRLIFAGDRGKVGGISWSKDQYLTVPIYHNENHSTFFHLHFWEGAASMESPHANIAMSVFPGFTVQVVLPLASLNLNTLFQSRTPGRLKNVSLGTPVEAASVSAFALEIPESSAQQTVYIGIPRLSDTEPEYKIPDIPVVDELGQWAGKQWPGKAADIKEVAENLQKCLIEVQKPLEGPFDAYGGWLGKRKEATGFFRTEHDGDRWWLIDPLGHPFFSVGPDCVRPFMGGPIQGIEGLFSWIPPKSGIFEEAWYSGDYGQDSFCYATANLIRVWGKDWKAKWEKLAASCLKHWGFNTIANWSEPGLGQRCGIPYVIELKNYPATEDKIFRDFPDVFDPEYEKNAGECVKQLEKTKEDPLLIGYFLRNEPNWGFGDYPVAEFLLTHPKPLYSKKKLVQYLRERYENDPAGLTRAWKYSLDSFEDLMKPFDTTAHLSDAAKADLYEFTRILVDEYIRVPAQAAKRVDRNHLNLGMRWAWIASDAFYAGSRYCDVFSINCYKMQPNAEEIATISKKAGLPVMIGEFHAGALDVGLPSTGLRGVPSQKERGKFYRWYVEHAAAMPELVGAHYFQWGDQPVLGRFDGENCNIGLVDICHRPYAGMVEAAADTHRILYDVCAGLVPPTSNRPIEVPKEGF